MVLVALVSVVLVLIFDLISDVIIRALDPVA